GLAAYEILSGRRFGDGPGAAVAGAIVAVLMALLSYDVTSCTIDPRTSTIVYRRRWLLRRTEMRMPFADVLQVLPDAEPGRGTPAHRRVVLVLKDGTTVPIVGAFRPDAGELVSVAAAIRDVLGGR